MRNILLRNGLLMLLIFSSCHVLTAQDSDKFAHQSLAEKIYLQTDNDIYTTNKTIWFKVVLVNAATHKNGNTSGVLYVDLINSANEIIESKLIKIKKGVGSGFFDLNGTFDEGTYMIRAYTEWNKNFGEDFISKKYVQIYSELADADILSPIQNIRIIDSTENTHKIRADFYPQLIDSSHENELMITVTEKVGTTDTVFVRQKKEKGFTIDYDVSKTSEYIDLGIRTSNGRTFKTTFSTQLNTTDLQFFPEGGQLVKGLSSEVGFKAIDTNGKGVPIDGIIINQLNDTIIKFKSNVLGMGSFKLEPKDMDSQLRAWYKLTGSDIYNDVDLPKVQASGVVMSVKKRGQNIIIGISASNTTNTMISIAGSCRGYQYFEQSAKLINGQYIFVIPKITFPEGVVIFTLLDENSRPIAERLYFNEREETRMNLDVSLDKSTFDKREAITLNVQSRTSSNKPLSANISVLTIDNEISRDNYLTRSNILSYLLLSSDLRGTIEKPGFYFKSDNRLNIDHLMLTQGWRNYKYDEAKKRLNYKQEKGLYVSGIVNIKNRKEKKRDLDLMLMTLDKERAIYSTNIRAPGSFSFDLEDIYGDYREVAIQSLENTKRDQKELIIALNRKKGYPSNFEYISRSLVIDSLTRTIINENRDQKRDLEKYQFSTYGTTVLDEVVLTGYNMTPKRQEVFDRYGEPDIVIEGDDIREKEKNWNWGLLSVLLDFFPDKVRVDQDAIGNLIPRVIGEATLYIVDGIPVRPLFYDQIQYMSVDEVTSFEILETSKNFSKLWIRVNGPAAIVPNFGGIISIYTKRGIGLQGALSTTKDTFEQHRIKVFAADKEFYAPEYDVTSYYEDSKPDLRLPIYWKSQVATDQDGKAVITYYHSDNTGPFQIIVEGISSNGQIGYQTINYSVKSNTN